MDRPLATDPQSIARFVETAIETALSEFSDGIEHGVRDSYLCGTLKSPAWTRGRALGQDLRDKIQDLARDEIRDFRDGFRT